MSVIILLIFHVFCQYVVIFHLYSYVLCVNAKLGLGVSLVIIGIIFIKTHDLFHCAWVEMVLLAQNLSCFGEYTLTKALRLLELRDMIVNWTK